MVDRAHRALRTWAPVRSKTGAAALAGSRQQPRPVLRRESPRLSARIRAGLGEDVPPNGVVAKVERPNHGSREPVLRKPVLRRAMDRARLRKSGCQGAGDEPVWVYFVLVLLVVGLLYTVWRRNAQQRQIERERAERRARTDELLARVLLGEESSRGGPTAGGRPSLAKPVLPPIDRMVKPTAAGQRIDVNALLSDEPTTVAARARRQLEQPTGFIGDAGGPTTAASVTTGAPASPLSLSDGKLDVPLDGLVVAWFEARGYAARRAPADAQPISLLLHHGEDASRNYAFLYYRGRLTAARTAAALEKARALGMSKLLVAAEHGAEPAVGSGRLSDVQVMDWPAIDRALKRIDARVAAKILSIARAN
jgi:hypothetical protein